MVSKGEFRVGARWGGRPTLAINFCLVGRWQKRRLSIADSSPFYNCWFIVSRRRKVNFDFFSLLKVLKLCCFELIFFKNICRLASPPVFFSSHSIFLTVTLVTFSAFFLLFFFSLQISNSCSLFLKQKIWN